MARGAGASGWAVALAAVVQRDAENSIAAAKKALIVN